MSKATVQRGQVIFRNTSDGNLYRLYRVRPPMQTGGAYYEVARCSNKNTLHKLSDKGVHSLDNLVVESHVGEGPGITLEKGLSARDYLQLIGHTI